MLAGLPDLHFRIAGVPGAAYRAFDRGGLVVAVPDRMTLEAESNGNPRLLLTLIRGGTHAASVGGRLEIGLSIESDLQGIGQALAAAGTEALLTVADLEGGVLTLNALLGHLVPTPLAPPQILPPDLLTRTRLTIELNAEAAGIASRLIEDATLPVAATMRLAFRAVAPRIPLAVTYDPRAVAERLATHLDDKRTIAIEDFGSALDALLASPAFAVEGESQAIDPPLLAQTMALRMKDRFAVQTDFDPDKLTLRLPQEVPSGRERIDFEQPAAVVVTQSLSLDPLSMARSMHHGAIDDLVRRIEVPPLPTGRQRIALSANLPEPVAGLEALVADVRAPALPPFRPLAVSMSVALDPPERRQEAELRLAPGEPLTVEIRLRAIVTSNGAAVESIGPWRVIQSAAAILGPADFGAALVVLRASRALTALAVVEVFAGEAVVARLDSAIPMIAIPLLEQKLLVVARPLADGRAIEIDLENKKRLDLDLATLPGFGAHRARLTTKETSSLIVEWRADRDDEQLPISIRMGADRPVAEISWIAASPFRPGMVWRAVRHGTAGPWSLPVLPQDQLSIEIDRSIS